MAIMNDKVSGLVYGLALGDAWGNPTEFLKYDELMENPEKYGPIPEELIITDDTQMSFYTMDAIQRILDTSNFEEMSQIVDNGEVQNKYRKIFAEEFVKFYDDPRNDRAPGVACMKALYYYKAVGGPRGDEGTVLTADSKGCGTIMRSPWLALAPFDEKSIAVLSILQSQTTHGHPIAAIASAWMTLTVRSLLLNNDPTKVPDIILSLQPYALLSQLPENLVEPSYLDEFKQGLIETKFVDGPLWLKDMNEDPCFYMGEGWVAEEAFYTPAFVAATLGPDNIGHALTRLVLTGGDSDSLAAMGGALLGAAYGLQSFNTGYAFVNDFEDHYRPMLAAMETQGIKWMWNQ